MSVVKIWCEWLRIPLVGGYRGIGCAARRAWGGRGVTRTRWRGLMRNELRGTGLALLAVGDAGSV